jgi:ppGpp synthetase/RelA/SpoT-type nucleotidyltranferase
MGLRWRDRDSVLHRIVNYVLLFSPETPPFNEQEFRGWTAYDLFYYVRSLVPVEIQIRTAFADTIAEQYHGAIYKGRPRSRKETEAPRKRLEELSRRLADLDNELEIDFENFADRIRTERAKEP